MTTRPRLPPIACDTGDRQFESSHWQIFNETIVNAIVGTKMQKEEAENGPAKK